MTSSGASYGPYSSREMHKYVRYGVNKKDGSRIVEKPSFVSFGSKEKPEPYKAGKNELPDRWKYKKWESPRVPVNAGEGYFGWPAPKGAPKDTPFKAFEYPGGKKEMKLEYIDKCSYRNAKRPEKVAFQSKDASRRDEFSSVFRTEQYREGLKKDARLNKSGNNEEQLQEFLAQQAAEQGKREFVEGLNETEFLYDIGRGQDTEFDPKAHRERYFTQTLEKNMARSKRMGPYSTMSSTVGDFQGSSPMRPEFGRVNVTKTFNDKGHL